MAESAAGHEQNDRAVEVLQRLLTDPEFRQTFRRDPGAACLAAGLTDAAAEFQSGGSALHTLEVRESKSSLAGLLMAAAAEGAAVYDFAEHMRSHLEGEMAAIAQQAADRAGAQGHAAAEHLIAAHADALPAAPAAGGAAGGGLLEHADAAVGAGGAAANPGQHVVHIASKFVGVPYVWGGESPSGFDCSGLVQYCFKQIGVHLERTTWDQVKEGRAVQWGHFQPGDLIFSNFEGPGAGATHVVIYAGHGQVIAAPHTGGHVEYESVDVFKPYFMGARRVVPDVAVGGGGAMHAVEPAAGHGAPGTFGMSAVPAASQPGGGGGANAAGVHGAVASNSTFGSMPAHGHGGSAADAAHGGGASTEMIGAYPGDNAPRAAIAHWMADAARKAGLPPELPVMAALVESGLKNDHYGDRDSLGFFQMRTSVWDHGKYAGFPKDPRLQLRWFLDEAVALKQQRLSEGYHNFGTDPHRWGDWIADIERPAAQYRGRYQLQLETARQLVR